jgi:hypothetical protein
MTGRLGDDGEVREAERHRNQIEGDERDEDGQRAHKTSGEAVDRKDQRDAADGEGEYERIAGMRRVGAGGDVDGDADEGDAGNDQERADDDWRKQRAQLADEGTDREQHRAADHHRRADAGEARGLGYGDHRADVDGMGAQHDRQPRADETEPERRDDRADPAAEHHRGQHRGSQVGRQVEQLADDQRRRDHRREHDQHVLQAEQQGGQRARPVLERVAQLEDGHAGSLALPGHDASRMFLRRNR